MQKMLFSLVILTALFCLIVLGADSVAADAESDKLLHSEGIMSVSEFESLLAVSGKPIEAYFDTVSRGKEMSRYAVRLEGRVNFGGLEFVAFTTDCHIVAGMSGSPVYINDRKFCALSYSFGGFIPPGEPKWGACTPLEYMLNESASGLAQNSAALPASFTYKGMAFSEISLGSEMVSETMLKQMAASGNIGKESIDAISRLRFNFTVVDSDQSGSSEKTWNPMLKAGMPIKADLIQWRDEKNKTVSIGALGTISHIDKNGRIYAFGHPFFGSGKVKYIFRTCEILGTVISDYDSFKIGGRDSDILGLIDLDSRYGIYGQISSSGVLEELPMVSVEFRKEGISAGAYKIWVAETSYGVLFLEYALSVVGSLSGAPLGQAVVMTDLGGTVALSGFDSINFQELYSPVTFSFGGEIVSVSSYSVALRDFLYGVYGFIIASNYKFKILGVNLVADFIPGKKQNMKLAAYKFPAKVIYGQNPVLEIRFVSEDNSLAIEKRLTVKIDWDQVEKPVYSRSTKDTEKEGEKRVGGSLSLFSASGYYGSLSGNEAQVENPSYFLNSKEYLALFSKKLQFKDNRVFLKVSLDAKSGLYDRRINSSDSVVSDKVDDETNGWHLMKGGVKERNITIKNEGNVSFRFELPVIPTGCVVELGGEYFGFEVVNEDTTMSK